MTDTKTYLEEMVNNFVEDINENPINTINEALDIYWQIDSRGMMKGFEILLTYGGPNIYLEDDKVAGYWGKERYYQYINGDAYNQIWDYLEKIKPCH